MPTPAREFVPGLELSRIFYEEAVRPILDEAFPGLRYAAARVGTGSEVLGFDTPLSADHEWGPRLSLFLAPQDARAYRDDLLDLLRRRLPKHVLGWPTHFHHADPNDPIGRMELTDGPVNHRVGLTEVNQWLNKQLGLDEKSGEPTILDWLAMPQQQLCEVTGGAVFRDELGTLTAARRRLAWYPDQVWRYLLACQWQRIAQEEAFVGRCAQVGDDLGSAVVAGRLVRDLMRLCLLLERRYAPYSKWLGSAVQRLPAADRLTPALYGAVTATEHADRERHLCDAYEVTADLQNATNLTEPVDPTCRLFYGRPFRVLMADRFAQALAQTITDPVLSRLPLTGAVDQWADNTDFIAQRSAPRAALNTLG